MKFLLLALLALLASAAYTPKTSLELAYMSAIAYESISSIQAWNCTTCKKYPLTDVPMFSNSGQSFLEHH